MKGREGFTEAYRRYFVALMLLVSAFAVIDRVALLTMGQAIKDEMRISDFQFGILSGLGFAIMYALLGLPLARLADTGNRVRLMSAAVAIWSLFSFLSGRALNFASLMLCRIVIGVGEAGVQPPAIAIISDLYPPQRRGLALAFLALGLPLGNLVGAIASGYLATVFTWRTVFLLMAAPGVVLALAVRVTLRDPPRGFSDGRGADSASSENVTAVFSHLARRRSFLHIVAALALAQLAAAGIGSFLPQYLTRTLALHLKATGLMFGMVAASSTLIGNLSGGATVDWISARDVRWYGWLPCVGLTICAPLYLICFTAHDPAIATVVLILAGAFLFLYYTPTQTVLQNMVGPNMRASAAFVFFLITSLVGYGFGPMLLGLVSDGLAGRTFPGGHYATLCRGAASLGDVALREACQSASASGIRSAMMLMSCVFLWAACHFFLAARTLRDDLVSGAQPSSAEQEAAPQQV